MPSRSVRANGVGTPRVGHGSASAAGSPRRGGTAFALGAGMQGYDVARLDPVCGREVKQANPRLESEYADVLYRFCSQQCLDRFTEQPDIFTAQPGRGLVAGDDRALRDDDHEGQLAPDAAAVVPVDPPAADPGG